ncbi:MAG: hypothetical protein E3J72_21650 [Planctomycetota bacterium]|nr:MAG: hypothetical protein E3J72_21650 [Planctomycetota bacterium]
MNLRQFIDKTWFLGLLFIMCVIGYIGHSWVAKIYQYYDAKIHIAALLFLSSFSMRASKLREGMLSGRVHIAAFITNWVVGTLLALAIGFAFFRNQPGAFVGIIIVAAIPTTMASAAVWTRLAGGNDGVCIAFIFIANISSVIVTPTILSIGLYFAGIEIIGNSGQPVNVFELFSFVETLKKLALVLILPVISGQVLRLLVGLKNAERSRKAVTYITQVLVIFMVFIAVGRAHDQISKTSAARLLVILFALPGMHVILLIIAYSIGRLMKLERDQMIPLLFSGAQKTLPVGFYLGDEFAKMNPALALAPIPTIIYHPTQLVIDLFVVELFNRAEKKDKQRAGPEEKTSPGPE